MCNKNREKKNKNIINERKKTMKTTRKILALTFALILMLALATTAMATTGGTITITGTSETEYSVYKMFNVETAVGGYIYTMTEEWKEFRAANYFDVTVNDANTVETSDDIYYVRWKKNTVSAPDAAAVAQLARDYVEEKGLTALTTIQVGNTETVAENGYYLFVPDNASASGVQLVENGEPYTIQEKTSAAGLPVVDKKVQEDSTSTFGEANTAERGQVMHYQTTITAGANPSKYVLHDKMDTAHVLFNNDIAMIRDGNRVPTSEYTVELNPSDGCTFHVVFHDSLCEGLAEDATVVVSYSATLSKDATSDHEHKNTTWLTYTDAPDLRSNEDFTTTTTTHIIFTKHDQAGNPLGGAGFVLQDNVGKYYYWNEAEGKIEWVDDIEDATEVFTDEVTGQAAFHGIDAENYFLVEKTIPGGYTGIEKTAVSTKSGNSEDVIIVNTLGQALPETGGIGTTVFYILGGLLVVSALVILVSVKRKNTVA